MNVINRVERNGAECRSCVNDSKEHMLEVLRKGRVTTIELTKIMELEKYAGIFELFENVSQITKLLLSNALCDGIIQTEYLENIFTRLSHLKTLSVFYNSKILKLMEGLNLKGVTIRGVQYGKEIENYFDSQTNIRRLKLTMESRNDGFKMLTHLSKNNSLRNNLTELSLCIKFNANVLEKIKKFQNLQVVRMDMVSADFGSIDFNDFPKQLRHIKIGGLKISCSQFFSLLTSLESLMVFDVGTGDIFSDNNENMGLGDSQFTTIIAGRLIQEHPQRTVSIVRKKSCSH